MSKKAWLLFLGVLISTIAIAQHGTIRGTVLDKETGEPIIYCNVLLKNSDIGATTDIDGFFTMANIPVGPYVMMVSYLGYDSVLVDVVVRNNSIIYKNINLEENGIELTTIQVSGRKDQAKREVQISTLKVTPKQIKSLPSTGGEPDIAQYLQIIPGVVSTGAQGGQIYIRGGAPIQNNILLDGMTIFNPFHSIGFFSVFETETIRSVDVYTGGFGPEFGARMSAIVDIKTREGNKKRFGGYVSASPFQVKSILEGPLLKLKDDGGTSVSVLFSAKQSILPQTSPLLYQYAIIDSIGSLPFAYTDLYGKISLVGGNGSKINFFGFKFDDDVNYKGIAKYKWLANGGGMNFKLMPPESGVIMQGIFAYTNYDISEDIPVSQGETPKPRTSSINSFTANMNFTYFGANSETNYGIQFLAFTTDIGFVNPINITFKQVVNNTEMAGYFKYRYKWNNLIIEPGVRGTYYASIGAFTFEPRFGVKYNLTDWWRIKAAGGYYSQELTSTVNERDIVNLFTGFITSPKIQKSRHLIAGFEMDLFRNLELNVEGYYKRYDLLQSLNRSRLNSKEPEFIDETGDAYGIDFLVKYNLPQWYFWGTYSLGQVWRDDQVQRYPAIFDRRHNVNLLASYQWGDDNHWEAGLRWNFGSGFRFTKILGFGERQLHTDLETDHRTKNGELFPIYSPAYNQGTLTDYHRLDFSLKRRFDISKYFKIEVNFSVTNAYNRDNILFVNPLRLDNELFQLPILPSLGINAKF